MEYAELKTKREGFKPSDPIIDAKTSRYVFTCYSTHSLTCYSTHLLTNSLTYVLTYLTTQSFTHLLTYSQVHVHLRDVIAM